MHFALRYRSAVWAAGLVTASLLTVTVRAQVIPIPAEDQSIATLQSEADYITHLEAFRALRQNGTEKSIPAIAKYLHDVKKSHLARYALEDMPYPEAGAALRAALEGATPETLPGIIATLGVRRDAEAVSALTPLLADGHVETSAAAASALGRIASAEAVAVLTTAYTAATDEAQKARLAEGLLAAAEQFMKDGKGTEAAAIYRPLRKKGNPEFVREAAFMGLALALPEKAPDRVLKNIVGEDPLYRNLAREVVAETEGAAATARYVAALPTLPEEAQANLLDGLARRGDCTARDGVVAALDSSSPVVKAAAATALGSLGSEADVPLLAPLMLSSDEALATAARNSLIRLQGDAINPTIVKTLQASDAPTRAKLLELLSVRIAPEAVPQATGLLGDAAGEVRLAALEVLLQQGSVAEMPALLDVMKSSKVADEQSLAARTFNAIAGRSGDEALPVILKNLDTAEPPVKKSLVEALGKVGGAAALPPVVALLKDADPAMQKTALGVLADWPTADALGQLLELAKSDDAALHDAGLRGYTRLARAAADNAMLDTAMSLTRSKEEKWVVLSALGTVHSGPSLDALAKHLDDPEVQKEAAAAILTVSEAVSKHSPEAKVIARKAVENVKAKVPAESVQKRASDLLAKLQ
ncbi:MAG: HEAT repeat domain-containing protein [Candidatus Hydrogenedentes bacterium]|nr:HEAT repeat domain-containing protein [Candidatus Hydrogenedentota bacterium]